MLCVLILLLASTACRPHWTPPLNPDPEQILREADADTSARRYEDALAKHVWFHQNALKLSPSLRGVRLSFALSSWVELGAVYPPALAKLQSIRDENAAKVCEGGHVREAFNDFESINKTLGNEDKTKDVFLWLHTNKPSVAKEVFDLAEPALVKSKEYRLCGDYLDADNSFQRQLDLYRQHMMMAQQRQRQFGAMMRDFGERTFSNSTATLVALLALNERKADAERIAAEALKEWNDPKFKEQLEKAKQGDVPAPWP
jgi:hypothetical protein